MTTKLREFVEKGSALLFEPGFVAAALQWPVFSVTSFLMISRLRRLGLDPQTVIDVGANVGQFAVAAGKLFPRAEIHSYEPVPDCFLQLERAASKMGKIRPRQLALGDQAGEIEFYVNTHRHSSSALKLNEAHKMAFPDAKESSVIKVRTSTLDEEYKPGQVKGPILLKLDVQGFEAAVIRGGRQLLSRVDNILVELSFEPQYSGEPDFQAVISLLSESGFHLKCAVDFLRNPLTGTCLQMDGLFCREAGAETEPAV